MHKRKSRDGTKDIAVSPSGCEFSRKGKTPVSAKTPGFPRKGLERREVEKRIYGVRKEAAHGFRNLSVIKILSGFEHRIKEQ